MSWPKPTKRKMQAKLALIFGILGASLVSFNIPHGFILFLISGIFSMIVLYGNNRELFALNAVYTLININGIIQNLDKIFMF